MESNQLIFDESIFSLPCEQFYITIASNPGLLQKGYEIVYKYLSLSQLNRQQTLLHLLSTKAPVLTLVTRTYPVVYADESLIITPQEKQKTKQFLILQILLKQLLSNPNLQSNKKLLTKFLLFLIHFHSNSGFQGWVQYYEKLLEEMIRINSSMIGFVLIMILKNCDDRVSLFSRHILQFVISNQQMLKITEQQSLEITYYCIKSMAYMNDTQDDVLQKYYDPYEEKILQYITQSMTKSVKIMKYSLKILTVMAADYEVELEKQLIQRLKQCAGQLVRQYLLQRITQKEKEQFDQEEDEQETATKSTISVGIILYQLIELFQTLLSNQQLKLNEYPLYLSICLPSLLLGKADYLTYCDSTQTYLADVEDEGEKTLRNKVVSFLVELIEGQYSQKSKTKMITELSTYTNLIKNKITQQGTINYESFGQQLVKFYSGLSFSLSLQKQHLPLFQQSILFLIYHLTEQILTIDPKNLQKNKQSLLQTLGQRLQSHSTNTLTKVASINSLNKIVKSMPNSYNNTFYQLVFIKSLRSIKDYQKQKGLVLGICRGIAYVSNEAAINLITQSAQFDIFVSLIENLSKYLLDQNTLQQSAYLILEFLLTLLKKGVNAQAFLKTYVLPQLQLHILSTFIHDGMIADVVIQLLGSIGHEELINYVYTQFLKGVAKQENLSALISKWVSFKKIVISQNDILMLLKNYNSQFISKLIKQQLKQIKTSGNQQKLPQQVIRILNEKIHPSWVLLMLGCNILQSPQVLLLNTISKITNQLTSQYEIQTQLLLPYYTLMNDPSFALNLIRGKSVQLYQSFISKLIRYAALFQGPNLKVITSLVLLNIAELDQKKIQAVIELISSYGNSMQTEQWQDENENDEQTVIDKMFNMKLTNDEVENDFSEVFGTKVSDMELINQKVSKLTGKL